MAPVGCSPRAILFRTAPISGFRYQYFLPFAVCGFAVASGRLSQQTSRKVLRSISATILWRSFSLSAAL